MGLQIRLLMLLLVLFLAGTGILAVQRTFDIDHSHRILASELKQNKTYFGNIVNLDGRSLDTLSVDYSFWDDMVTFVKTDNVGFAHDNLDTGLDTFNADADWVYRPNGSLVYFSTADDAASIPQNLNLPQAFFAKLSTAKFAHFYMPVKAGTIEIRAATIVPSNDPNHKTPAQGYWLVGRLLNASYTANLAHLAQSNVMLESGTNGSADHITSNSISFGSVLRSWNGSPVSTLHVNSQVSLINDLNHTYDSELAVLTAFATIVFLVIVFAIWRFVLLPLRLITVSVEQKRPDLLGDLSTTPTEFGSLAATVQAFFQQKAVIVESEAHKKELEKRNQGNAAFVAATAAQLNGLMNSMRQFVGTITQLFEQHAPASDIKRWLDYANGQLAHASMLLNDLQHAGQGDAELYFEMQDFDIGPFLQDEVTRLKPAVRQELALTDTVNLHIRADKNRLGQVMTTLMSDCAHQAHDTDTIEIGAQVDSGRVTVGVRTKPNDTVKSPQAADSQVLQVHNDVTNNTPPDLAIVKQIIANFGGRLWTDATSDNGTCYYFSLPEISSYSRPESFTTKIGG